MKRMQIENGGDEEYTYSLEFQLRDGLAVHMLLVPNAKYNIKHNHVRMCAKMASDFICYLSTSWCWKSFICGGDI